MSDELDGIPVDRHAGRFSGTFDLDEAWAIDTEVTLMVVVKVAGATHSNTKAGELKRINKLEVLEVGVVGETPGRKVKAAQAQASASLNLTPEAKEEEEWLEVDSISPPEAPELFSVASNSSSGTPASGPPSFGRKEFYDDGGWS